MTILTQKIVPHFWFNGTAEAAAACYGGLLPASAVGHVGRYSEVGRELHGQDPGSVMSVEVQLGGYLLLLLNGGPSFQPTPALSLFVTFEHEDALDTAWQRLAEGGTPLMPLGAYGWSPKYGWLNDRYGVSWQLALGRRANVHDSPVMPALLFTRDVAGRAEEAVQHYTTVFPQASLDDIVRHDGTGVDPADTVMQARFRLAGQSFLTMDSAAGHAFGFTEGASLMVICDTQEEIDHYWRSLSAVPEAAACGWLKDRFGLSWQVVPRSLIDGLRDPDPAVVDRVVDAFMSMKKLDVAELDRARQQR